MRAVETIPHVTHHAKVSLTIDRSVKVYRDDVREAVQRNDREAAAMMYRAQEGGLHKGR